MTLANSGGPRPWEIPLMIQFNTLATYLRARFGHAERGASLVEYALLVALIAVVCIAAVTLLGRNPSDVTTTTTTRP